MVRGPAAAPGQQEQLPPPRRRSRSRASALCCSAEEVFLAHGLFQRARFGVDVSTSAGGSTCCSTAPWSCCRHRARWRPSYGRAGSSSAARPCSTSPGCLPPGSCMRPAANSAVILFLHCFLVLLPTSRDTATQSRPCRLTALLSLSSSTLLHESWTCLPPGSCMRPAATSLATLWLHCLLVLLPTSRDTATQSRPSRDRAGSRPY